MKRRRKLKAKIYYILYKIGFRDFALHGLQQIYLRYLNEQFEQANCQRILNEGNSPERIGYQEGGG